MSSVSLESTTIQKTAVVRIPASQNTELPPLPPVPGMGLPVCRVRSVSLGRSLISGRTQGFRSSSSVGRSGAIGARSMMGLACAMDDVETTLGDQDIRSGGRRICNSIGTTFGSPDGDRQHVCSICASIQEGSSVARSRRVGGGRRGPRCSLEPRPVLAVLLTSCRHDRARHVAAARAPGALRHAAAARPAAPRGRSPRRAGAPDCRRTHRGAGTAP